LDYFYSIQDNKLNFNIYQIMALPTFVRESGTQFMRKNHEAKLLKADRKFCHGVTESAHTYHRGCKKLREELRIFSQN
jgi:hypothetical protein